MNFSKNQPHHKLNILQGNLRRSENIRRSLVKIRAEEQDGSRYTIGEHDRRKKPTKTLNVVVAAEDGTFKGPDGTAKESEGEAWIENEKKKVAIFR